MRTHWHQPAIASGLFRQAARLTGAGGPLRGELHAMAVPKGQAGRLAYISEFVEEAKASGLVQRAIERGACAESGWPHQEIQNRRNLRPGNCPR